VGDLLQGRLAPVLRELVAAFVRFEWYFKPLLVPDEGRKIVFGGLATSQAGLDARLVLNSAERTALGLAWFLALHLLQPVERRRVLALDDPTSVFDHANQGAFVTTLCTFLRLTRPEQVVVSTHDDALASLLAEELAPTESWPLAVGRIRCQRDSRDCTEIHTEWIATTTAVSRQRPIGLVSWAIPPGRTDMSDWEHSGRDGRPLRQPGGHSRRMYPSYTP
jgi:hypothetical protein